MRLQYVVVVALSMSLLISCAKKKRFPDSKVLSGDGGKAVFQYDTSVGDTERTSMEMDIENIARLKLSVPPTGTEAGYFQLNSFDGNSLSRWLNDRVKYIIGENYAASNVTYSNYSNFNPVLSETAFFPMFAAQTVMQNTGAGYWLEAKDYDRLYKMKVNGNWIEVRGPRVGIIQIGEALFGTYADEDGDPNSMVNSLRRISTYFHEARHSDGHGSHAAFPHAKCTSGTFVGEMACEQYANGPYILQATLLDSFYKSCVGTGDCTTEEGETLRVLSADKRGRTKGISTTPVYKDPTPERLP